MSLKETDRIATSCMELKKLGVDLVEFEDGTYSWWSK